ncbi:hypothetical protein HUJ04_012220 [Dendroctonus ponderosae]|nr:hypothetical protein HUJ04_012220 [Dendroctonus ponderosae]
MERKFAKSRWYNAAFGFAFMMCLLIIMSLLLPPKIIISRMAQETAQENNVHVHKQLLQQLEKNWTEYNLDLGM